MYNDTFWGLGSVKRLRTTVADPGFPVGGGVPTSDVGTFRQKCMRK